VLICMCVYVSAHAHMWSGQECAYLHVRARACVCVCVCVSAHAHMWNGGRSGLICMCMFVYVSAQAHMWKQRSTLSVILYALCPLKQVSG
jgi:hypothetical protein